MWFQNQTTITGVQHLVPTKVLVLNLVAKNWQNAGGSYPFQPLRVAVCQPHMEKLAQTRGFKVNWPHTWRPIRWLPWLSVQADPSANINKIYDVGVWKTISAVQYDYSLMKTDVYLKQPNLLVVYSEDWQHPHTTHRCAASFRTPVFSASLEFSSAGVAIAKAPIARKIHDGSSWSANMLTKQVHDLVPRRQKNNAYPSQTISKTLE